MNMLHSRFQERARSFQFTAGATERFSRASKGVLRSGGYITSKPRTVISRGASSGVEAPGARPPPASVQAASQPEDAADDSELFPVMQLELPTPTFTKVKTAAYLSSCVKHEDCPQPKFPEFAVIGRSNVGKSSLINMITNSKRLAHVSKEPGKTRCINHFLINGSWYLVDLPGYGYARVGVDQREQFEEFTKRYFLNRPNLTMVFLLIDSSILPQKVDLEYVAWLSDNRVPFCLVFTKTDKKKKGAPNKQLNMTAFKRELLKDFEYLPPSIATSADDGTGKVQLLNFIAALRVASEQARRPSRPVKKAERLTGNGTDDSGAKQNVQLL